MNKEEHEDEWKLVPMQYSIGGCIALMGRLEPPHIQTILALYEDQCRNCIHRKTIIDKYNRASLKCGQCTTYDRNPDHPSNWEKDLSIVM